MAHAFHVVFVVCVASMLCGISSATCGPNQTYPSGIITTVTVSRPEGDRYFLVYVPTTYRPNSPAAVQFVFHGLNDNCDNFINATGFIPYAESNAYLLVAPCGSIGLLGIAWNSGTCCGFLDEQHPNDFAFARQMVTLLREGMCVDDRRIVATGFSNGAFMSQVLACESPDIFRGIASVSGIVELRPGNAAAITRCTENISAVSTNRPSILMIHGDLDILVPWTGDGLLGFPPVPDNAQGWVSRNDCDGNFTQTLNVTDFTNQVWNRCTAWGGDKNGSVELVRHHGGGHEWPENNVFDTTGYIHEWMMRLFA